MAKKRGGRLESQLDWYYISRESFAKVAVAFVVLLALVVGGIWFFMTRERDTARRAREDVAEAERLLDEIREMPSRARFAAEIAQVDKLVADARQSLAAGEVRDASRSAVDAQSLARRIAGGKIAKTDATVVDLAGHVELQRASQTTWEPLRISTELRQGDFIKTGPSGTAEVMSSDGTLYRIKPETLFEVHGTTTVVGSGHQSEIKFIVGNVDVNTGEGGRSIVKTDAATADIARNSSVGMENNTVQMGVSTFKGQTILEDPSGHRVTVGERERALARKEGGITEKVPLPETPSVQQPDDNASFDFRKREPITLRWTAVREAQSYQLQIARSRLFVPDSIVTDDDRRTKPEAIIGVNDEGTYFWRVRCRGRAGADSDWSLTRRFKVVSGELAAGKDTKVPPDLVLQRPQVNGSIVILIGRTEPGATVTVEVNGSGHAETADVDAGGAFRQIISLGDGFNTLVVRAVNGAGLETVRRESVLIQSW